MERIPPWAAIFLLPSSSLSISNHVNSMWMLGAWEKPLLCPLLLHSFPHPDSVVDAIFWCHGGQPLCPLPVFLLQPVSVFSQVVYQSPPTSVSSLHVAEGPGSPQVLHLSNKVETIKPACQAILFVLATEGGHGWLRYGDKFYRVTCHIPSPV